MALGTTRQFYFGKDTAFTFYLYDFHNKPSLFSTFSTVRQGSPFLSNYLMSAPFGYQERKKEEFSDTRFPSFPGFQPCASLFTAIMKTRTSSDSRENVNYSLLTELVNNFQSKYFGEKFQISSLSLKEFLRWVLSADTSSQQQAVAVLRTETESWREQKIWDVFCSKQ